MRSSQGTAALIPACSQLYALSNPSPSLILPWTQVLVRCQGGLGITSGTSGMPPGGWRYVERSSRCGLVTRSSFRCVRKPAGPRQQDLLTRGDRTRIRHDTWTKRATHEEHLDRKSEDIVAAAGSTAIDSALRKRSHQSCAASDTIGVQVESSFRCQAGHKNHASRNFDPKLEPLSLSLLALCLVFWSL